jgi:hypothetical protein
MVDLSDVQRLVLARARAEAQKALNDAKGIGGYGRQIVPSLMKGVGRLVPPPFSTRPSEVRLDLPTDVPEDAPWWVPHKDYTSTALNAATEFLNAPARANPPATPGQAIFGRAIEEVGAGLPFAGFPIGAGVQRAKQGINTLRAFGKPAALELGMTGAMGTGAGIARQYSDTEGADALGMLAGAGAAGAATIGGKYSVLGLSVRAAQKAKDALGRKGRTARNEAAVGKLIGEIPEEDLAKWETGPIPGARFTIAEATGRPDLIAAQKRIDAGLHGAAAGEQRIRRKVNEDAIADFAEGVAPTVPARVESTPRFVIDTATNNITDLQRSLGTEVDDALQVGRRLATSTGAATARAMDTLSGQQQAVTTGQRELATALPEPSRDVLGAGMREAFIAEERAAREGMTARMDELNLTNVQMFAPYARFRQAVHAAFKPGKLSDKSNIPDAVSRILTSKGGITFGDLMDLRRDLGNEIRMLSSGQAANPMKAGLARRLRRMLDEHLLGEGAAPGFAAQGADYKQFRLEYFENVIEPFENNSVFKVTQANGRDFYATADENLAGLFFGKGKGAVQSAQEYRRVFGGNQEMTDAIVTTALDSLRDYAVRDGVINPARLTTWVRDHKAVLDVFPGLTATVRNIDSANMGLATRADQLREREKQIKAAALSRALGQETRVGAEVENLQGDLTALGQDPFVRNMAKGTAEKRIAAAIKSPEEMKGLMDALDGNFDAIDSLRLQVWDGVNTSDPAAVAEFISKNNESLIQVFNFQHLADLQRIANSRVAASRGGAIGTSPMRAEAGWFKRVFGQSIASLSNTIRSTSRGRTNIQYEVTALAGNIVSARLQQDFDNVLAGILYDPEAARRLAAAVNDPKKAEESAKWLRAWLLGGATGVVTQEEE